VASSPARLRRGVLQAYGQARRLSNPHAARREKRDTKHLAMLLPWILRVDSNCVDVGAHTGTVLRRCVELAPNGTHFAFEPIPELAAGLRSRFPQVGVVEAAVYDEVEPKVRFNHFTASPALSGLTPRPPGRTHPHEQIDVRQTTLDAALPDDYRIDFLKIDVEGAELGVLKGGAATIARSDPTIFVEFGQSAADYYGSNPSELLGVLHSLELRLFDIDGGGPYRLAGLTEHWEARDIWNFVAHR
jgi:FkbM family methyltransferase